MDIEQKRLTKRALPGPALAFARLRLEEPKAIVGIVHGYADHSARYEHVQEAWAEAGIASIAIDLRGHGRAEGKRGSCRSFEEYLDDVEELAALLRQEEAQCPLILFGHSFGGLVATRFAMTRSHEFRALVMSAPFFGLAKQVPTLKIAAGKVMSRLVPEFGLPSGLTGQDVTRHVDRARKYDADPLVFKNANARWFTETSSAQASALSEAPRFTLPTFVGFGTADRVAKRESARAVFDALASQRKSFVEYEGFFHEILNDPGGEKAAADMAAFMLGSK